MKRIFRVLAFVCLLAAPAMASTIPITGTIRMANGNLFNGRIRFTLSYGAARDSCSSNIVVAQTVEFPVANGALPSSALITPNDCLQPANTFYTAEYMTGAGAKLAQNVYYVSGQTFNIGTAIPTPVTTSNISFGDFTGLVNVTSKHVNGIRMADLFTGATGGAKIASAIADLPSTGGTVMACGIEGPQTISSDPFAGVTKPVTLMLCTGATYVSSISFTVPGNVTINYAEGAVISMNGATLLTYNGGVTGTLSQHFAGAGSVSFGIGSVATGYTAWFGDIGDNINDDTAEIQAGVDACRYACKVEILQGTHKTTATIVMRAATGLNAYSGMVLSGTSKELTTISYSGPTNTAAIQMVGFQQEVRSLHVVDAGTGWQEGIQYGGTSTLGGFSSSSKISDVWVECNDKPGDGISIGRGAYQADQITIDHPYITYCTSGAAVNIMDPNAVTIGLYNVSIGHNFIGVKGTGTGTKMSIFGGEMDNNGVNVLPGAGADWSLYGVRSEGSKKTITTTVGGFPQPITFDGYQLASTYAMENTPGRPAATATSTDATHITLSVPPALASGTVVPGDYITIAGAGFAGALLHTRIASMVDTTHAVLDGGDVLTPVTNATVLYDASVQQVSFSESGGGPYTHTGNYYNFFGAPPSVETAFTLANGPQTWTSCGWGENLGTPFGITYIVGTSTIPASASWSGNYRNASPSTRMLDHFNTGHPPTQYFASNGGANNAWVISGGAEPLGPGLIITVYASAFTLQVGANTLDYNGTGPVGIYRASLGLFFNLNVAVPVNAVVTLFYDSIAGVWRLLGQ